MKHSIRINGQIQTIACEFGTGIVDKNGREFFEGDMVKFSDVPCDDALYDVVFRYGQFVAVTDRYILDMHVYEAKELEVVDGDEGD